MTSRRTLAAWLEFIERQHPDPVALGLERVAQVLGRLEATLACPVFVVGGTNGKGSTCALMESILRAAGYRTGLYSSPHLLRYAERVRVEGHEADDAALVDAFAAVEDARGGTALTYFEFGTLAAAWLFARERLDVVVLEVGLGGRLDAVNAIDADCAVLTSIGIDHVEYLGGTRAQIGREKAGIFRSGRPAVVADPEPPRSIAEEAQRLRARLLLLGRDFGFAAQPGQWTYWSTAGGRAAFAYPALRGAVQLRNAAAALAALETLRVRLPVSQQEIRRGLASVRLPGRFQIVPGRPRVILDVAHNPEAASVLAQNLLATEQAPQTIAVFGMLNDKDIRGVIAALAAQVTRWHLAKLAPPRGASSEQLMEAIRDAGIAAPVFAHASPAEAFAVALSEAGENDKIVVCGSFLTVGEIMRVLERSRRPSDTHG